MYDYDKAIEKIAGAVDKGFNLVDDFFYTKEEKAKDESKRAEDYHKFMELTSTEAQLIRSKTRAKLVKFVVYPYVVGWIACLPLMIVSVWYPPLANILQLVTAWLKMYTPIAGAFGGGYIGYYGLQMIAGSFKQPGKNKK